MTWIKLLLFVAIVLLQYLMKVETAGLSERRFLLSSIYKYDYDEYLSIIECLPNQIRLINSDDVENSYVEGQDSRDSQKSWDTFKFLLSLNNDDFFIASKLPNKGNFTFNKTLLLLGFTTQGNQDSYVSEFCISYSNSSENSYQNYTQIFQVNSDDQKIFFFEESILAKKIQLFIRNGIVGVTDSSYYWQLNLFGCEEDNATNLPDPIENSCTVTTSTVTTSTVTTSTVTSSTLPSSTVTTSTVMETPVQFTDQKSDNCQKELISAIIVPVIIILIFLILSVTILIIYITWKGKGKKSATLKEISNNALYSSMDEVTGKNVTYNKMYRKTSSDESQTNTSASIGESESSRRSHTIIFSEYSTVTLPQDKNVDECTYSEVNPHHAPVSHKHQYEDIDGTQMVDRRTTN